MIFPLIKFYLDFKNKTLINQRKKNLDVGESYTVMENHPTSLKA